MTDTNNTDGAALLPVTPEDREAFREICLRGDSGPNIQQMLNSGAWDDDYRMQELIRFRQSHSLPGDVGTAAINQNDAMRQEIAHVGNKVSDLARAMGVDQANDDGTWPDLGGRIDKLIAATLTPSPLPATQEDAERSERREGFAPCPTCRQYSHSIDDDALANAFMHFEAMAAHPVRGHPMGHIYDDATRDAAQVLVAAAKGASTPQRQEYDGEAVREALERTLSDPQRLLWRDDVEGICPTPGVCWEYGDTARCGPCAIKQAEARGVVSDMSVPNLPEVSRLRRELSSRTLPDGEALANELDAFVLVRTNDPALAIEVGDRVRSALAHPAQARDEMTAECPNSPSGKHQIDTSMEEGPHHCFYCSTNMRAALSSDKGEER